MGLSIRGNGESGCHFTQWWHNFYPKSHLIYTVEGVRTYLQSDFSYTCTAVAAWGWDEEWVLITEGGGCGDGRHRGTEGENCKYSEQTHHSNHAMFTMTMDLNHRSSNFVLACCWYPGFADCSSYSWHGHILYHFYIGINWLLKMVLSPVTHNEMYGLPHNHHWSHNVSIQNTQYRRN